jgi:hypothetical protein
LPRQTDRLEAQRQAVKDRITASQKWYQDTIDFLQLEIERLENREESDLAQVNTLEESIRGLRQELEEQYRLYHHIHEALDHLPCTNHGVAQARLIKYWYDAQNPLRERFSMAEDDSENTFSSWLHSVGESLEESISPITRAMRDVQTSVEVRDAQLSPRYKMLWDACLEVIEEAYPEKLANTFMISLWQQIYELPMETDAPTLGPLPQDVSFDVEPKTQEAAMLKLMQLLEYELSPAIRDTRLQEFLGTHGATLKEWITNSRSPISVTVEITEGNRVRISPRDHSDKFVEYQNRYINKYNYKILERSLNDSIGNIG